MYILSPVIISDGEKDVCLVDSIFHDYLLRHKLVINELFAIFGNRMLSRGVVSHVHIHVRKQTNAD